MQLKFVGTRELEKLKNLFSVLHSPLLGMNNLPMEIGDNFVSKLYIAVSVS